MKQFRTSSELLLARPGLSGCIFGAFTRDTFGANLRFEERFSHFGASPFCCISWIFEGDGFLLDNNGQLARPETGQPIARISFSGPQTFPRSTWSSGETNGMIVAFYPDAFSTLTGIAIERYFDQTVAAGMVLPDTLMVLIDKVAETRDAKVGFQLLEQQLEPIWQQQRPGESAVIHSFSDWIRTVATRAMFSSVGKSTRQIERRIKRWTGHSKKGLSRFAKTDLTYEQALISWNSGKFNLADLSTQMGYSDQAHMTRFVKKQTGYSPAELMKRIEEDEAFWSFRLLGERY